jgi:hypothetical protein
MDEIHQMHKELHAKIGAPAVVENSLTVSQLTGLNDLTKQVLRSNLTPEQVKALMERWKAHIVLNPGHLNPPAT